MGANAEAIGKCEKFGSTNHGVIPRWLTVQEGLGDAMIWRLVGSGRWQRIGPQAYVPSGVPITWRTQLAAVQARLKTGFAFSHRTAGALMDMHAVPSGHIEVVTTRCVSRTDGLRVHRTSEMPRTVNVERFPVTSGSRTVLDLFAVLRSSQAELALEDALRRRLTTYARLWDEYATTCKPGRKGCRSFRTALLRRDDRDGKLQSRMETRLRRIMSEMPGDPATPQFRVDIGDSTYFIDFAFADVKLGIEAHSMKWHRGEAKWYYDMRRDRVLKRAGWTLVYFAMDDLLRPAAVRSEIRALRDALAPRLF